MLWAEIIDCIFKSYLKGQSLCYFTHSDKEEYPKIYHSIHNRKRFPKKETPKIQIQTEEPVNMFQSWLLNDFSEAESSGTDCSSSDDE